MLFWKSKKKKQESEQLREQIIGFTRLSTALHFGNIQAKMSSIIDDIKQLHLCNYKGKEGSKRKKTSKRKGKAETQMPV